MPAAIVPVGRASHSRMVFVVPPAMSTCFRGFGILSLSAPVLPDFVNRPRRPTLSADHLLAAALSRSPPVRLSFFFWEVLVCWIARGKRVPEARRLRNLRVR